MTFDYGKRASMRVAMTWRGATRQLTLQLAAGSRMLAPSKRPMPIRVAGSRQTRDVVFEGRRIDLPL